jgi:hypothetical protein
MRAAADALRKVDSVHVKATGKDISFDIRLVAPDGAIGMMTVQGVAADVIRLHGSTYVRYGDTLPPEAKGKIEPHRWIDVTGSSEFADLTLAALADEISGKAGTTKPEVQRTTEAGQPVLLVESTDGFKLWVSNVGQPLPLRELDEDGIDGTFTEYGAKVDIKAPPAGEVVKPPAASA